MKVLLRRAMFIGGIYYEPNPAGTVIPDKIGDRTVVLFDPANPPRSRRDPAVLFTVSPDSRTMTRVEGNDRLMPETEEDRTTLVLPEGVVEWTDEAARGYVPERIPLVKGHPKLGTEIPLSALTPGLSKAETQAAIDAGLSENLVNKAEEERALLDPGIVGVASLGPSSEPNAPSGPAPKTAGTAARQPQGTQTEKEPARP